MSFFYYAIIAYSETGDPEVLEVIKTAVMCCDENHIKERLNEVEDFRLTINKLFHQQSIPGHEYAIHHTQMNSRLSEVEKIFKGRTYSMKEIELQEKLLKTKSSEYFKALNQNDRRIFLEKFPNVFKFYHKVIG